MSARAELIATMTEAELQAAIVTAARFHGWAAYHTHDSRRSEPGFPDLVLVHPRHGVYFAELKSASGRVTADQRAWLDLLRRADAHTFLWRPEHLDEVLGLLATGRCSIDPPGYWGGGNARARAERRRQERAAKKFRPMQARPSWVTSDDGWVGTWMAWCASSAELDEAKRATHDTLIEAMGDARTGGVEWRIFDSADALDLIETLFPGARPEQAEEYRRIRGLLREHGGHLVVALAPGAHPTERTPA